MTGALVGGGGSRAGESPDHGTTRVMTEIKEERVGEAREQLALANRQWDDAAAAAWDPPDAADCVTKCFYAFENAVVAAAMALGIQWEKNHGKKADLAAELSDRGEVKKDIRSLLRHLNDVRKDISYEEPGPELTDIDLEDLVGELEEYLGEVDALIDKVEQSD